MRFDEASKEWKSEWLSENINGGCLSYQYVLRPYTIPQTFTITFIYKRPGRIEWSWTTPAIPYVWSASDTGEPADPDHIVGSGVATVYVKTTDEDSWTEKLLYPEGTGPEDYNTPAAEQPWTVNLEFGIGGDIEVPNLDDIAKIIGVTVEDIKKLVAAHEELTRWINENPQEAQKLVHAELQALTGGKISLDLVKKAWPRLIFTSQMNPMGLQDFVDGAYKSKLLKNRVDVKNLFHRVDESK